MRTEWTPEQVCCNEEEAKRVAEAQMVELAERQRAYRSQASLNRDLERITAKN